LRKLSIIAHREINKSFRTMKKEIGIKIFISYVKKKIERGVLRLPTEAGQITPRKVVQMLRLILPHTNQDGMKGFYSHNEAFWGKQDRLSLLT
jgi:hypothetical protein